MGGVLAAEQGRVPHAAIVGVHVDLGPHAAALTALCARLHLNPHLQVLLHRCTHNTHTPSTLWETHTHTHVAESHLGSSILPRTVVPALGLGALLPLLLHLLGGRVVDVGFALVEQLLAVAHDDGKTVAGVGELVWFDLQHGNVFQNDLRGRSHR